MIFLYVLIGAIGLWVLRELWPVSSLRYVDAQEWEEALQNESSLKLLDVRDSLDYQQGHVPGSINLSLGRLPYVWQKELSPDNPVVILSESRYQSHKAARLLHKRGFRQLYALKDGTVFSPVNQFNRTECFNQGCRR